jgi:SM-20-related protein
LDQIFDQLINSFIDNKVGITTDFLSLNLAQQLKYNLIKLQSTLQFKAGGTSNKIIAYNREVRSDQIFWLDRSHNNEFENQFFDLIDSFVLHLNNTCYTGITSYEFHYAYYEKGSFYTKHLDQFRSNDSRKYSMILYLNENWKIEDGGELCIHHADKSLQHIAPLGGTSVFFSSSELLHEVLVTQEPRMSITGWLKVGV